jgi:predicted nucleic acid-binding protein
MNVLLDTNIVLDVLLDRIPFVIDASAIWAACDDGRLVGFLTASTVTDIFYIARRASDVTKANIAIGLCLSTFEIATLDRQTLEYATTLLGKDFEDSVQIACAVHNQLAAIVTRNTADYAHAPLPVLTPAELLAQL